MLRLKNAEKLSQSTQKQLKELPKKENTDAQIIYLKPTAQSSTELSGTLVQIITKVLITR